MAKKVVLLDDVSGDVIDDNLGGGTIRFSVEDDNYTIDLGLKNAEAFHKSLQKWVDAATKVESAPEPPRRGRPAGAKSEGSTRAPSGSGLSKEELQNIRDWAGKNGHEVAPRGRIKQEIIDAYMTAHATPGSQPD